MAYKFRPPASRSRNHGSATDAASELRQYFARRAEAEEREGAGIVDGRQLQIAQRADDIGRIGSDSDPIDLSAGPAITDIPASSRHDAMRAVSAAGAPVFVEEGTEAWKAWQAARHSTPCTDALIEGKRLRGWWFPTAFPDGRATAVAPSSPWLAGEYRPVTRPVPKLSFVDFRSQHAKQVQADADRLGAMSLHLNKILEFGYMHKDPASPNYLKAWPGNETLVKDLGNPDEKTFRAARKRLVDCGHWKVTPARGRGERTIYEPILQSAKQGAGVPPPEVDDAAFEIEVDTAHPTAVAATETSRETFVEDQVADETTRPATLPGPIFTPPRRDVAYSLRRSPDALRAGASPVTFLTPDAEHAERQRARMDRDHYLQLGASVADAEELAARPMSPDAKIREVISRMGARGATFDPGPSFEGSQGSIGDSALPPIKDRLW